MNTETSGSTGTHGTLNDRGVLFWGRIMRSIVEPFSTKAIKITTAIAHPLAWDRSCEPQIIIALSPTQPMQLVTMAASANEAVLCDGCRPWSSFEISVPSAQGLGHLLAVGSLLSVNLARSAALAYTITTLISGLSSPFQLSCILISINREAYCNNRQKLFEMLTKTKWRRNNRTQIPFLNNKWLGT